MSEEERLDSDADFKPNLVNSVCYLVEQVGCPATNRAALLVACGVQPVPQGTRTKPEDSHPLCVFGGDVAGQGEGDTGVGVCEECCQSLCFRWGRSKAVSEGGGN